MRRLVYLAAARRDLKSIHTFVSEGAQDFRTGEAIVGKLREQCKKIARLSNMLGRPRPDLRPDLRSFVFGRYLIFLQYSRDTVEIVRILDGRRNIDAIFERDFWRLDD